MSIIIAKIIDNTCVFKSDTKVSVISKDKTVTGDGKLRPLPEEGILKTHIIHPSVCVAFSGSVNTCIDILNQLMQFKIENINFILTFLNQALLKENDDSDFIVAGHMQQLGLRLFKVNKSGIEEGQTFWTGVKEAFNEFQQEFLREHDNKEHNKNFSWAFTEMLHKSNIPTIGDFEISVFYNKKVNAFIYDYHLESKGGYAITKLEANTWTPISEGTVEEGAYVVTNLISNNILKPAVCTYFSKGKVGFLYFPISKTNKKATPEIINNVTIEELKKRVADKHGINLIGMNIDLGNIKFRI